MEGDGKVFIEFSGGAEAWTQESKVVADTTSWGRLFHSAIYCAWEKLHLNSCTAYSGMEGHTQCHGSS